MTKYKQGGIFFFKGTCHWNKYVKGVVAYDCIGQDAGNGSDPPGAD